MSRVASRADGRRDLLREPERFAPLGAAPAGRPPASVLAAGGVAAILDGLVGEAGWIHAWLAANARDRLALLSDPTYGHVEVLLVGSLPGAAR